MLDYQKEFREIGMKLMGHMDIDLWYEVYNRSLCFGIELRNSEDQSMQDILNMQFEDANRQFGKFIESNYESWVGFSENPDVPLLSHRVLPSILPEAISGINGRPVYLVVIDNLRLDQWQTIAPQLKDLFRTKERNHT